MLNWIVWIRIVLTFKLCTYAKLNCFILLSKWLDSAFNDLKGLIRRKTKQQPNQPTNQPIRLFFGQFSSQFMSFCQYQFISFSIRICIIRIYKRHINTVKNIDKFILLSRYGFIYLVDMTSCLKSWILHVSGKQLLLNHAKILPTFKDLYGGLEPGCSVERIPWSNTSHKCSIHERSREFFGQSRSMNYSLFSWNHSRSILAMYFVDIPQWILVLLFPMGNDIQVLWYPP